MRLSRWWNLVMNSTLHLRLYVDNINQIWSPHKEDSCEQRTYSGCKRTKPVVHFEESTSRYNVHIERLYFEKKELVDLKDKELRTSYEYNKIESAVADDRKTWRLCEDIVFNRYRHKQDRSMAHLSRFATFFISVHGYIDDIDNFYLQHSCNNWSFREVDADHVNRAINSLPCFINCVLY